MKKKGWCGRLSEAMTMRLKGRKIGKKEALEITAMFLA